LIIGLAAVAAGLGWLAWNFIPLDPTVQALRVASEGAIRTHYLDPDPPAGYTGGPLPSAAATALKDKVAADIARFFTPQLQARYTPMMLPVVDQIGSGYWDTGDLSISWGSASINGDLALISFDEHDTTVRYTSAGLPPARLESTWHVEMSLIEQDGQWRVDSYRSDCLSGCP
jgi:hypothetical protein